MEDTTKTPNPIWECRKQIAQALPRSLVGATIGTVTGGVLGTLFGGSAGYAVDLVIRSQDYSFVQPAMETFGLSASMFGAFTGAIRHGYKVEESSNTIDYSNSSDPKYSLEENGRAVASLLAGSALASASLYAQPVTKIIEHMSTLG